MSRVLIRSLTFAALLTGEFAGLAAAQDDVIAALRQSVGTWTAEIKSFPNGPDAEPVIGVGKETNRMLGDLWLISQFEGEISGVKFEGQGVFGFNPETKKYIGTWVDSMSPFMTTNTGTYDAASKTMTMEMTGRDPSGAEQKGKIVEVHPDENTRQFTMYGVLPGSEEMVKMMEAVYKRQQ